jgi:transposase
MVGKYANHQPLNRQSEQYARESVELPVSTMADHVGACGAALLPLYELIKAHCSRPSGSMTKRLCRAGEGETRTGRVWTYVRDDRPFAGADPPAAVYFYSPDRRHSARLCTAADTNLIQTRVKLFLKLTANLIRNAWISTP